jgi:hypothetical protein
MELRRYHTELGLTASRRKRKLGDNDGPSDGTEAPDDANSFTLARNMTADAAEDNDDLTADGATSTLSSLQTYSADNLPFRCGRQQIFDER